MFFRKDDATRRLNRAASIFCKPKERMENARYVLSIHPDCAKAWYLLGLSLNCQSIDLGETDEHNQEILDCFRKAYDLEPGNFRYAEQYIDFLVYTGQIGLALPTLRDNKGLSLREFHRIKEGLKIDARYG